MMFSITIAEKEMPFHAGFRVQVYFEEWKSAFVKSNPNMGNAELGVESMIKMAYMSFREGCRRKGEAADFTETDIENWLDVDIAAVHRIEKAWSASQPKPTPEPKGKQTPRKKRP